MNHQTTRKIADLARLKLTDQEVQTFTPQLESILQYVSSLEKLDVSKTEPLFSMVPPDRVAGSSLREDEVKDFNVPGESPRTLGPAPEVQAGGFKVPPILDGE